MEIKGILFDKDGTLIDFYEVWGSALTPVLDRILEKNGLSKADTLRAELMTYMGVKEDGTIDAEGALAWKTYEQMAREMLPLLKKAGAKNDLNEEMLESQLSGEFFNEICEKRKDYPTFTDIKSLMKELHAMGIFTGLATTDEYNSTKICIDRLGIEKWISFYGTAGNGLPEKPNGKLLQKAAKEWGVLPEEIAVVGDTPTDMRFAKNGNAVGIGVLSGTGKEETLKEYADYIIASVDELLPLVKELSKKQ